MHLWVYNWIICLGEFQAQLIGTWWDTQSRAAWCRASRSLSDTSWAWHQNIQLCHWHIYKLSPPRHTAIKKPRMNKLQCEFIQFTSGSFEMKLKSFWFASSHTVSSAIVHLTSSSSLVVGEVLLETGRSRGSAGVFVLITMQVSPVFLVHTLKESTLHLSAVGRRLQDVVPLTLLQTSSWPQLGRPDVLLLDWQSQ